MKKIKYLLTCFCVTLSLTSQAQEESERPDGHSYLTSPHAVAFMVGYAWVPAIVDEAAIANEVEVIPTLGFDYTYFLSHKWGIGIVNDIEFARYFIIDEDGGFLERENKYVGALTAVYEPTHWLALFTGPGLEADKHRTFPIFKIGIEVGKRFENGWSWGINASIDFNELYETYSGGLVIGKRLP